MSQLPETMTQIEHGEGGAPEVMVVGHGALPKPAADEVLIRTEAVGINRPDVAQRSGTYPPPPGASKLMGLECAGEVVGVGDAVTRFKIGDKVCALTNGGAYAQYCTAPEAQTLPWPAGFDALTAAALPETYFTVWANLFGHGKLAAGESVLIHGGTSGIGVTAIQLAKAFGATVYATAGSAEKVAACLELGADAAIDYKTEDFSAQIKELTGGKGVDVVLDMVGAPYFTKNLRCLKMDGRLVMIAFLQGHVAEQVDLRPIMVKRLTVTGSTMRPRTTAQKGEIAKALEAKVWPMLAQGKAKPRIFRTFPLAEVVEAHRLMESSTHIGKIMLTIG